jgi:ADP-heptose:LPS heptosyltransferase
MSPRPTVLAIRIRQLGDVLATLGTLRAIKSAAPDHRVAFVVDAAYHELLSGADYIDELLPSPPHMDGLSGAVRYNEYVARLRELNIECVLDFHSNTRSAILSWLSGAPVRIGFDVRARKLLYSDVEPRIGIDNGRRYSRTSHESAIALARRWLPAIEDGSPSQTIPVSTAAIETGRAAILALGVGADAIAAGVVGLNPGNPYQAKEWPDASFVEVARRLRGQGRSVVLLWGPGELPRVQRIATAMGEGAFVAPQLSLRAVPGFLRSLSAIITIDSGMKHIAVAAGTPTVTLFGPTNPDEWHMGGGRDRYLSVRLSCSPCRLLQCPFGDPPCMARLTPHDVLSALSVAEGVVSA